VFFPGAMNYHYLKKKNKKLTNPQNKATYQRLVSFGDYFEIILIF
jgi:hypothetical protein